MTGYIYSLVLSLVFAPVMALAQLSDVQRSEVTPINIQGNAGFENGKAKWTPNDTADFAIVTSGTNLLIGKASATWDADASTDTLTAAQITIPKGYYGQNGYAYCSFQTPSGTATHEIQVYDGTNVLAETSIVSSTLPTRSAVNFIFPSSGTIGVRVYANADEPLVAIDDCYLGLATNVTNVSQTEFFGSVRSAVTASCVWSTTSASYANFAADTDCPTPSVAGFASAPSTKIPAITFSSLPPGEYLFIANGYFVSANAGTSANMAWQFNDGTNAFGNGSSSNLVSAGSAITGRVQYTTAQSNITINLQAKTSAGTNAASIFNDSAAYSNFFEILVYRYPLSSQTAFTASTISAVWSGYQNIGTSWSTTSTTYADFTASGSATLVERVNINSGIVATAASNLPGIIYPFTSVGIWTICVTAPPTLTSGTSTSSIKILAGSTDISEINTQSAGRNSVQFCGLYNVQSVGSQTVKLQGKAGSSTTLRLADSTTASSGVLEWIVYKGIGSIPAPLIRNSVVTSSNGVTAIESGVVECDASSAIVSQNGSWISSVGNISGGACTVTLTSGIFSATPTCVTSMYENLGGAGIPLIVTTKPASATSVVVDCASDGGTACSQYQATLICNGPK